MLTFVLQRVLQAVPVVLISTVAVFLLLRLIPGDPAQILAGADSRQETIDAIRRDMGLDQPLPVQYGLWLSRVAQGDLGRSLLSRIPISTLLLQRIPATLELTAAAILLTLLFALPLGIIAAGRPGSWVDWVISSMHGVAIAVPGFWLGIQPPTPSWGGMLNESRAVLRQAPWFGVGPGVALAGLLIGLNYLSDALRQALDPRRVNDR